MNLTVQIEHLLHFSYYADSHATIDPLLFHVESAGCNYVDADFEIIRDETYPYYTIHLLFDGCGFFHIAGQNYFLTKGDAFVIIPGQAHTYCNFTSDSLGLLWIEVSGIFCKELFHVLNTNAIYAFHQTSEQPLTQRMLELLSSLKSNKGENPYEVSAKVYTFFMQLLSQANHTITHKTPQLFSKALNEINQHFSENLSIQELAESLGISTTYLNKLFHKYTGTSTIQYIKLKRMEYACSLLADTNLTCESISEKIGIYDASYFHKVFKSITGLTPSQYRKKHGNSVNFLHYKDCDVLD